MKYRAPEGVTALFCAGQSILPDDAGCFEADAFLAPDLAAHGCAQLAGSEPVSNKAPSDKPARVIRARAEKVD